MSAKRPASSAAAVLQILKAAYTRNSPSGSGPIVFGNRNRRRGGLDQSAEAIHRSYARTIRSWERWLVVRSTCFASGNV
jgi:hypothetical protein